MNMSIYPISQIIPESNIVVFSPHFDDVLFTLGGYILELRKNNLLQTKKFHILILFPRSNYLAGTGEGNFDTSLDRLKLATGKRLLEDLGCNDELLGEFNYRYELIGERECFARSKPFANSEMEFPHGMYEDFDELDKQIFSRMQARVMKWAAQKDTALVFPLAIKEHIDHFIVREAGIKIAHELGKKAGSSFYFQEDKPYGGIATKEELDRIEEFIQSNKLKQRGYRHHPEIVLELAYKHYVSQVEEVYKKGILERSDFLKKQFGVEYPCDQIFAYEP
jgi:hypothetical protein